MTDLAGSFRIEVRVVHALLMREVLTRYGRHNIGFLWLFVEPMLFTTGVAIIWTLLHAIHGSSLPIVAFALTGYSSILLWRNMGFRTIGAVLPNLSLLYHRNIKLFDIYVSRLILELVGATASFVVLSFVFGIVTGDVTWPEDLLEVIGGWALLAWYGMAFAILIGALSEKFEIIGKALSSGAISLHSVIGAAFQVDALPRYAQDALLYLPTVNGLEIVREGFFGSKFVAHYDVAYTVGVNAAIMLIGLIVLRKTAREITPE